MTVCCLFVLVVIIGLLSYFFVKKAKALYKSYFEQVDDEKVGNIEGLDIQNEESETPSNIDANTKLTKINPGKLYMLSSAAVIGVATCLFLLIELLFRFPCVQNCYSSFDSGTTIQILVGIMGASATVLLGIITIIHSKIESFYSEQILSIQQQESDRNQEKRKKELQAYINSLHDEYVAKERERENEIAKKEYHQMLQTVYEYFDSFEFGKALIFGKDIQFKSKSDILLYPSIFRYIDRDKDELCVSIMPKGRLPVYFDILLKTINITFNNGKKLTFDLERNQYDMNLDSISLYFPYDIENISSLVLFNNAKSIDLNDSCVFELVFDIIDKSITKSCKVQTEISLLFELSQLYTYKEKGLPEFLVKNVRINSKGD